MDPGAIESALTKSFQTISSQLDQKFDDFAKRFSQENTSAIDSAVTKAKRESFICKRKGNQQQYDHCQQVLEKFDESLDHLRSNSPLQLKRALEEGAELVMKRIKAIKLADKSEFGWATVNEYLSDDLASDSDDEKRIYRSERRAEKKIKEQRRRKHLTATAYS